MKSTNVSVISVNSNSNSLNCLSLITPFVNCVDQTLLKSIFGICITKAKMFESMNVPK